MQRLYYSGNSTNRSHACAGSNEVILTCHGRGSNITWIATSDSVDIGRIVFFNYDTEGTIVSQGIIRGILIDVDSNNNLVSELRVHTTPSMRPISIACSSQVGRSTHLIAPAGKYNSCCNNNNYVIQLRVVCGQRFSLLFTHERGWWGEHFLQVKDYAPGCMIISIVQKNPMEFLPH